MSVSHLLCFKTVYNCNKIQATEPWVTKITWQKTKKQASLVSLKTKPKHTSCYTDLEANSNNTKSHK